MWYLYHNQFFFGLWKWKPFVFENENITLEKIWLLIWQDLHSVITITCITPLLNIVIFKIKSNYIFNLQELHQKTWNCKSSLFKKHSQWEQILRTCQERPDLVCGYFVNEFYKTTTCPRRPLLSGPKNGCFIEVWLYFILVGECATILGHFLNCSSL